MVRRSTPQSVLDEAAFSIRVRMLVPECGFGQTLGAMHRWLDREVGRGDYAHHAAQTVSEHATALYFRDVEHARRVLAFGPASNLDGAIRTLTTGLPLRATVRRRPGRAARRAVRLPTGGAAGEREQDERSG